MYAEERQQAMAQLISRRGRLSVVQLAEVTRGIAAIVDHGRRYDPGVQGISQLRPRRLG